MKIIHLFSVIILALLLSCAEKAFPVVTKNDRTNSISILTYNIHHANPPSKPGLIDVNAIANVIKQEKADLIALQEVDVHTNRSGISLHEADEIARLTGMKVFFAKAINYDGGEYGVAILSKFPMEKMNNIPLPTDDHTKGEHRTLATAIIILPNKKKIVFACTHLDAQHDDLNRQLQIRKILEVVKQQNLPLIIAGDLNAVPESDVIKQFDSYLTRTCITDCSYTIPEMNPDRTIDYIGFSPAEKFTVVMHSVVAESYASDHRPVKAILRLR